MSTATISPVVITPFGAALKRLKVNRGYTNSELARRAGIDQSYVSRIQYGDRQPSRGVVVDIAAALGCDEAELQSLLVSAGYAPADGLTIDADLLALNEALASDDLPDAWKDAMRDSVRSLLAGCVAFRGRPRVAIVPGIQLRRKAGQGRSAQRLLVRGLAHRVRAPARLGDDGERARDADDGRG